MANTTIDVLHLVALCILFVSTAFWFPLRIPRTMLSYVVFTIVVLAGWWCLMLATLTLECVTWNDVPGFDYFGLGFVAWMIGSAVYLSLALRVRRNDRNEAKPPHRSHIRRIACIILLLPTCLYVCSYAILSMGGGYVVCESGENRPAYLAAADCFVWFPRHGLGYRFRQTGGNYIWRHLDSVGALYLPLMVIDRTLIHRTIWFIKPHGTLEEPLPHPSYEQYHPFVANPFFGRFPYGDASNGCDSNKVER